MQDRLAFALTCLPYNMLGLCWTFMSLPAFMISVLGVPAMASHWGLTCTSPMAAGTEHFLIDALAICVSSFGK